MKTAIQLVVVLLFMTSTLSCSEDHFFGSGEPISEMREVNSFSKVSSEGVFEVTIIQGTTQSVEIIADDNIIHKVKTKVVNNELRLYLDNDNYRNISLEANITVTKLNGLKNYGTGNIYAYDIFEEEEFTIQNSGSADILFEGSAASLDVKNEGSGNILGFNFLANDSHLNIEGSGNIEVTCSNTIDITIYGSGNLYYKGSPTIDADINGSGQIVNSN